MSKVFDHVGSIFHGGPGCPVAGCLGEFAAADVLKEHGTGTIWEGYLFLWDDSFNDFAAIAGWFRDAGGFDVSIMQIMHCDTNGYRDGRFFEGGRPLVAIWTESAEPSS
jgi:hypothetical protein